MATGRSAGVFRSFELDKEIEDWGREKFPGAASKVFSGLLVAGWSHEDKEKIVRDYIQRQAPNKKVGAAITSVKKLTPEERAQFLKQLLESAEDEG